MKNLMNWLAGRKATRGAVVSSQMAASRAVIETLEDRQLLAAGPPNVISVFADNRGQIVLKFDEKMNAKSLNNKSIKVTRATASGDQAVAYSKHYHAGSRTLTLTANVSANTVVKVRLVSKLVKDADGKKLDGEFRAGLASGNGRAGGDYFIQTAPRVDNDPLDDVFVQQVARYTTNVGTFDVEMFEDRKRTLINFLGYANAGDWDGTIFHRAAELDGPPREEFVVQGGGFKVDASNRYAPVHDNPPMIQNEPNPGSPGNIRGTIAMARSSGVNSATDQWYFNMRDNRTILDNQNGGFTVFGQTNTKGLVVLDKIAALNKLTAMNEGTPITGAIPFFVNQQIMGAFTELPNRTPRNPTFSPKVNSVIVTRLAMHADVVAGVRA